MNATRIGTLTGLGLMLVGIAIPAACEEAPAEIRFESIEVEPGAGERLQAVGGPLGFSAWPRPAELFVAPAVSRALLAEPAGVAPEVRACTVVRFGGEPWGRCEWSWQAAGEEGRRSGSGRLDLEVTLTPSSAAAQELLLSALTESMLPTAALAAMAQAAERPEGLGTVAVLLTARGGEDVRLRFTRSNVAFHLWGQGRLAAEVLPLARRLDAQVLDQQPLTWEQLLARRPRVDLSSRTADALPFGLTVPGGREVLTVVAFIDGQPASAREERVSLAGRSGAVEVEVVPITRELLAGSARSQVRLED